MPEYAPILFMIGELGVSEHWIINSSDVVPIAGSRWVGTPYATTARRTPRWAIACAVVFVVFCLLGLLFLLVKENRVGGY